MVGDPATMVCLIEQRLILGSSDRSRKVIHGPRVRTFFSGKGRLIQIHVIKKKKLKRVAKNKNKNGNTATTDNNSNTDSNTHAVCA